MQQAWFRSHVIVASRTSAARFVQKKPGAPIHSYTPKELEYHSDRTQGARVSSDEPNHHAPGTTEPRPSAPSQAPARCRPIEADRHSQTAGDKPRSAHVHVRQTGRSRKKRREEKRRSSRSLALLLPNAHMEAPEYERKVGGPCAGPEARPRAQRTPRSGVGARSSLHCNSASVRIRYSEDAGAWTTHHVHQHRDVP